MIAELKNLGPKSAQMLARDSRMALLMQLDDLQRTPQAVVSGKPTGRAVDADPVATPKNA